MKVKYLLTAILLTLANYLFATEHEINSANSSIYNLERAAYQYGDTHITQSGGRLFKSIEDFSSDLNARKIKRVRLNESETKEFLMNAGGEDAYNEWITNRKGLTIGNSLLISGGVLTIVCVGAAVGTSIYAITIGLGAGIGSLLTLGQGNIDLSNEQRVLNNMTIFTLASGATALACYVAGTTTHCIYKKRLKNNFESLSVKDPDSIILSFGLQDAGLGIALRF